MSLQQQAFSFNDDDDNGDDDDDDDDDDNGDDEYTVGIGLSQCLIIHNLSTAYDEEYKDRNNSMHITYAINMVAYYDLCINLMTTVIQLALTWCNRLKHS